MTARIIHLATGLQLRGGERQVLYLHRALRQRGVNSVVFARVGSALARELAGEAALLRGRWDIRTLLSLVKECRRNVPPILHCHDSIAFNLGALAGALTATPVVLTRRSVFPVRDTVLNRWKYNRCAEVAAVSRAVRDILIKLRRDKPVCIVHDGVRLPTEPPCRATARKRLGVSTDVFLVGSVGYFTAEKNFPFLVELARTVAAVNSQCRIVCIGPISASMRASASEIPSLILAGEISDAAALYGAFDAYVSPSTREGLGTALLEAVVRDIPTVALDAGGTRDIFEPDSISLVGHATEFMERATSLLADPSPFIDEAKRTGERARRMFSIAAMVDGTMAMYDRVVASGQAASPPANTA